MNFIQAIPRDIVMLTEVTLTEARHLQTILDNMTFNMDSNKPSHVAANNYLHETLYPNIEKLVHEMEEVDNGS